MEIENFYRVTNFGVVADVEADQTRAIQKVFDMCRENGGKVVISKGVYHINGLRLWSNMTLYLESGAVFLGSEVCEDYPLIPIPEGVEMRSDMEMFPYYYDNKPMPYYRRAMISAYGCENITIIGEEGSLIDGQDCTDPEGEEGFRGPHGIYLTNIKGLALKGYTIRNCGNFMHQIDNCQNLYMTNVTMEGGSDGVHLHHCVHTLIEDCVFHTGDDCVAGINIEDLLVRRCEINTSCDAFRIGGNHIHVEDCHIWGPGIYPHRMTVVQNRGTELVRKKENTLAQNEGRHNLLTVFLHFSSINYPATEPYHDIVFKRCKIENVDRFATYHAELWPLEVGAYVGELRLEDSTLSNILYTADVYACEKQPLDVYVKNVKSTDPYGHPIPLFTGNEPFVHVHEE